MKKTDKFTFFWKTGDVFSNWHPSPFVFDGINFNNSEQYMMYYKAKLFNDTVKMQEILDEPDPKEQKKLGRMIADFNDAVWLQNAEEVMVPGLKAKFQQNPTMLKELMDTNNTILAEASPSDIRWGIGLKEDDPLALDEKNWKGTNLLGVFLMKVREQIRKDNQQKPNITFEEFNKLDIRICKILSVEKVEKADKLYKLQIDTGFDKRIVVSAISQSFLEKDLINQHIPFVLNLEPRKIRGIESNAMFILGETVNSKKLFMISPLVFDDVIPSGDGWKELTGAIVI